MKLDLKKFYKSEQLHEPLEKIKVHEKIETFKTMNMTRII